MKKMLTNTYFYCPSHNYPFEATNFSTTILGQQLHLLLFCSLVNKICFTKGMQRMHFGEGAQTRFWTCKLKLFAKFKEAATRIPQFNGILHIFFIAMTMSYHAYQGNGQLSKPTNHFVCHKYPWECSFCTIHFVMDNNRNSVFKCIDSDKWRHTKVVPKVAHVESIILLFQKN